MGLLKSVNNVPGIDFRDYREHEYYNKYKYRAKFAVGGAKYLFWWRVQTIEMWKQQVLKSNYYSTLEKEIIVKNGVDLIVKLKDFYQSYFDRRIQKDYTARLEGDSVSIFSNNLDFLHSFKEWDKKLDIKFTEVCLGQYTGVKYFVHKPKNNFRVYLKTKRVPRDIVTSLDELLKSQKELKPSFGLTKWIRGYNNNNWKYNYLSSAFFIDYNNESTLSYLALMHGDILGKKYKLEKRTEAV